MKKHITEDYIKNYFQNYYKIHKRSPKSNDKSFPFSNKLVSKYYGTWCKALKAANLPLNKNKKIYVSCMNCEKKYLKSYNEVMRYTNHFCKSSCSAIYNNKRRTTGTRISKLEVYLQERLTNDYKFSNGKLDFQFNNRSVCDGYELDIYIESLKLAFEINGIFHYKPIFGQEKLDHIMKKDLVKNQMCKEKGIDLITIKDDSNKFSVKYGEIVYETINMYIYQKIHSNKFKKVMNEIECTIKLIK